MEPNLRERIGGNNPPGAIELAKPTIEALGKFLKDYPVIASEDEAREAKLVLDRTNSALKSVEEERRSKVDPLREQMQAIHGEYSKWHNASSREGIWDKLVINLRGRITAFAVNEERKRREAAEAARAAAAEAERKAREAEEREREAAATAAAGVCDVDIGAATQEADDAFRDYQKADRISQRAIKDMKVRIGGGLGKVSTLRSKEILTVTDWRAAIQDICGDEEEPPAPIVDAILTCARAYRKVTNRLPSGIESHTERSL